jgi:hypothetical protein
MRNLLTVTGGVVQLQLCALYVHRVPVLNEHHVCPESWFHKAGQPVHTPLLALCPNCHSAVHTAIDGLLKSRDVSALPPRCVALARKAFELAEANGLVPAPTL